MEGVPHSLGTSKNCVLVMLGMKLSYLKTILDSFFFPSVATYPIVLRSKLPFCCHSDSAKTGTVGALLPASRKPAPMRTVVPWKVIYTNIINITRSSERG